MKDRNKRYASHRYRPLRNPLRCGYWIRRGEYNGGAKTYRKKCQNSAQFRLKPCRMVDERRSLYTIGVLSCRRHVIQTMNRHPHIERWEVKRIAKQKAPARLAEDIESGIRPTG